jgi:translation initiation factor 2 gamma subunit (eIF-2gamma)
MEGKDCCDENAEVVPVAVYGRCNVDMLLTAMV